MARVIVVGGGISGLACAWGIRRRLPEVEVLVLEAAGRAGGVVGTRRRDGYTFDLGPSGWMHRNPSTLTLTRALGLGDDTILGDRKNRGRFVLSGGKLSRFPDGVASFLRTDLLTVRGKTRALLEPVIPHRARGEDESALKFARRRLGVEVADLLVDPVVAGIFAGDPGNLSVQATLPSMARIDADGRSLLLTALRPRGRAPVDLQGGIPPGAYVSYRHGMGQVVDALVTDLGDSVRLGQPVERIGPTGHRWVVESEGGSLRCDAVVLALPGPAASRVLKGAHPDIAEAFEAVPYVPVAVVGLGFEREQVSHELDGYGYLVPSREAGDMLGVLWPTSIFPGARAPRGRVLMRVMLGGSRTETGADMSLDGLAARAVARVTADLGIEGEPDFVEVVLHRTGLPQYRVRHLDRVTRLRRACGEVPGLHLVGNAMDGVGMNALTAAAEVVAEAVAEDLGGPQGS